MKILAIDAATEACSAALLCNGEQTARFEIAHQRHTELMLPMVEDLLTCAGIRLADLDALAVDRGPGSFTGVRISAGVAQGLALAAELPVIPVSSLAILAQGAVQNHGAEKILAVIDARMNEVYWAYYEQQDGRAVRAGKEQLSRAADIDHAPMPGILVVGSGASLVRQAHAQGDAARYATTRYAMEEADRYPRAQTMLRLAEDLFRQGRGIDAAVLEPVYLRNNVAKKKQPAPTVT